MAHYAKVVDGVVVNVIVADQEFFDNFIDDSPGEWIQTSYNTEKGIHLDPNTKEPDGGTALRKNFAGIGYIYDRDRDAFYEPQPAPSWTLDEETCVWQPPVPHPGDGGQYTWNEETQSWDQTV